MALTDEQYAHINEAWRLFDTDEDGLITPQDLQRLLLSFGYRHTVVRPRRAGEREGTTGGRGACGGAKHRARLALLTHMRVASRRSLRCTSTTFRFVLRAIGASTSPSSSSGPSNLQRPSSRSRQATRVAPPHHPRSPLAVL